MNVYFWIVYIIIGILSFLPIVRIDLFSVSKKYTYFKYLSISLFIWAAITGLTHVIEDSYILYPMLLVKYPVIFFATGVTVVAFMRYLDMKIPKFLIGALWLFLFIEIGIASTNHWHQLFLDITFSEDITAQMILTASTGTFFLIHTVICYLLLLISLILIIFKMYSSLKKYKDTFPFVLIIIVMIIGIILNFIHVFIEQFTIDPTLIIYVVFSSVIYFIFYIRDVRLILKMNNNQFVLQNLREMYLIVNHHDEVVAASKSLLNKFNIKLNEGIPMDDFMMIIHEKAIVYSDSKGLEYDSDKMYIHMQTKNINLPFFKYQAHMILFYDETQIQKYIHDMEYLMNHDLMTQLYNRNYLESIRSKHENIENYTCILFDLDGLKLFNDYFGHHAGDDLLKRFASVLNKLSEEDQNILPIRMGGDEFLIIATNKSEKDILNILNMIQEETKDEDPLKQIGFSYGYHAKEAGEKMSQVLSKADINMYQMKVTREVAKNKLEETLKKKARYKE
ncbi:diguanylate cyclase [Hujiaoplasma nucleasis]|uniref:Diguanylate cyclase n=1 Tax=Hujiaoplasma nucleasis TaxID=2725268 RepID=A0A7L6N1H6_9MOLU|nr:GGDEF domain-containing protein [Hujiaoplasma nucleasis]QLY40116.1 diguanylate cyclase [Hujiaoplasma nucleasis]